jgi:hypothetical protein
MTTRLKDALSERTTTPLSTARCFGRSSHDMAKVSCTCPFAKQDGDLPTYELLVSATDISVKKPLTVAAEKGQTWFFGERPVHVRFNQPYSIPRFADFDNDTEQACVVIGTDIVDEDALRLTGIEFHSSRGGF